MENSYFVGFILIEFYFYVMGGCEGLIDIVVKISEIGNNILCIIFVDLSSRFLL